MLLMQVDELLLELFVKVLLPILRALLTEVHATAQGADIVGGTESVDLKRTWGFEINGQIRIRG